MQKLVLDEINISWVLYKTILIARILWPLPFIGAVVLEWLNFYNLWLYLIAFPIPALAAFLSPFIRTNKIILSKLHVYYDDQSTSFSNIDKVNLTLSEPYKRSLLMTHFSFYKSGIGSCIELFSNEKSVLKLDFFLKDKEDLAQISNILESAKTDFDIKVNEFSFRGKDVWKM